MEFPSFVEHLLMMGQKLNNNNRANKHQKLETILWYLSQKLDMLGHRHGHLVTIVHQSDSSTVVIAWEKLFI
jgi:hypothetical protein